MDIDNLQYMRWACRRGMLELDLILLPFFDAEYLKLSVQEKQNFLALLQEADPDLLNWLMGHQQPPDTLTGIVNKICQYVQDQLQHSSI